MVRDYLLVYSYEDKSHIELNCVYVIKISFMNEHNLISQK